MAGSIGFRNGEDCVVLDPRVQGVMPTMLQFYSPCQRSSTSSKTSIYKTSGMQTSAVCLSNGWSSGVLESPEHSKAKEDLS